MTGVTNSTSVIHVTWKCDIRQKLLDLCMCATGAKFCIFPAFQRVWTLCVIARKQIFHIFRRLRIWYTYRPSVHQNNFASKEITFQRSGDSDTRIGHSHKVVATWRHACGEVHIPENSNVCLKILFYFLYFQNKFSKIECMFSSQEFQIFNQSSKYIHECYPLMRKLLSGLGDGVHSGQYVFRHIFANLFASGH